MLLVSAEELRKALNKGKHGRNKGDTNLSHPERVVIGAAANLGTCKKAAESFGVSQHHTHELKHSKHSNAQGVNVGLREDINSTLDKVEDKAANLLFNTLDTVSEADIANVSSVEKKTKIAANLSGILSKISSRRADEKDKPSVVIFYAPERAKMESYEIIEAG